jgi:hypothetical protein
VVEAPHLCPWRVVAEALAHLATAAALGINHTEAACADGFQGGVVGGGAAAFESVLWIGYSRSSLQAPRVDCLERLPQILVVKRVVMGAVTTSKPSVGMGKISLSVIYRTRALGITANINCCSLRVSCWSFAILRTCERVCGVGVGVGGVSANADIGFYVRVELKWSSGGN